MFSAYMKKLSAVQKLAPEEERTLWRAYKENGDMAARRWSFVRYIRTAHCRRRWMRCRRERSG